VTDMCAGQHSYRVLADRGMPTSATEMAAKPSYYGAITEYESDTSRVIACHPDRSTDLVVVYRGKRPVLHRR